MQHHKFLLATCYRHCNQGYRAVQLLKGERAVHTSEKRILLRPALSRCCCCGCLPAGSVGESSRYLAALCCLDLRQYTEAESLLIGHGQAQVRQVAGA